MKLIHRLGYYGLGLFFGIVILIFFLSGKKTSCDYSPNARVLKNIRTKKQSFSDSSLEFFRINKLDTSIVSRALENGNVNFTKSNTDREPCNIYYITGTFEPTIELEVENCDSIAIIKNVQLKKGE